jgi:transposase InsO family protein
VNLYRFIEAEKAQQRNVKRACELLEVSRAAYYAQRPGTPSARQVADAVLTEQIRQAHQASKGRYGAPRVHAELRRRGHRHGKKRVARLMRWAGLRGRAPRRWNKTTVPDPAAAARADLIGRDFSVNAAAVTPAGAATSPTSGPGKAAVPGDEDRHRLAPGGRLRPGRASAHRAGRRCADQRGRRPRPRTGGGVPFGQGYISGDYATLAEDLAVCLSTGRTGQCWDNALAESFFASLKGECLDHQPWPTRAAARHATVDYIAWYNGTRLHSALGYMTPNEFETATEEELIKQGA